MGRTYAACLGCLALASCILHGLFMGELAESVLIRGISMLFAFTAIGWLAGNAAELVVRQSLEMNYRVRIERLRQKNSNSTELENGGLGKPVKAGN